MPVSETTKVSQRGIGVKQVHDAVNRLQKSTTTARQQPTVSPQQPCAQTTLPPPLPGKKGACLTLRPAGQKGSWVEHLPQVIALRPYWNYSWGLDRIDSQPDDIEFLPMVWGRRSKENLEKSLLEVMSTGKVKLLLGWNEPDSKNQANLQISDAMELWPIFESMNVPLVGPSCVDAAGPWMKGFMSRERDNCANRVDYVGVHWYGGASAEAFKVKMWEHYQNYGRPLLITEFATADWQAKTVESNRFSRRNVLEFMKVILPWMEAPEQIWIAGYAWFPFEESSPAGTCSSLFDVNGDLTALGRYYASIRSDNPTGDHSITVQ